MMLRPKHGRNELVLYEALQNMYMGLPMSEEQRHLAYNLLDSTMILDVVRQMDHEDDTTHLERFI